MRLRDVKTTCELREDWGLAILPNPVCMTTSALERHLDGFYEVYDALNSRPQRFNMISAEEFKTLKTLVPADTTALFDFLLTKVGVDPAVLVELGVTPARAASVNLRFSELISVTALRIRERIRLRLASINDFEEEEN